MSEPRQQRLWRTNEVRVLREQSGMCALRVAQHLGRSPRSVQDKARLIGVRPPRMPHACYWTEETKQRALRFRRDGLSVARISRAIGVPFGTVRHWIYDNKGNP